MPRARKPGRAPRRVAALLACVVVVWASVFAVGRWQAAREAAADAARVQAEAFYRAARQLGQARAEGKGMTVASMSRTEAGSWAYWESVARRSGIGTKQFDIRPSMVRDPGEGPGLLATTVSLESVSLRQVLALLHHMKAARPAINVSSVEATRASGTAWNALIQAFLYFVEPATGP